MDPDQARSPSESQHSLGEEAAVRPLQDGERTRRVAPFAAVAAVAFVAVLLALFRDAAGADASIFAALVLLLMIAGALGLRGHRLMLEARARVIEYRSILETAHESFIAAGADGRIVDWNQQAERDFGWSRDEVIGRQFADTVIPPRSWEIYREGFGHLLRTGEHRLLGRRFEMPAMHRDGSEFPVEITVSALPAEGGYRLNLFLHDISRRRANDRALREAEERFRRSFHDSAAGMAIVSTDGEWLQVNQALADLTGYAKGELTGMRFVELTHPDDVDAEAEALDQLVGGERRRYVTEKRYVRADGRLVWVSLSLSPVRDEDGDTLYLISQMQDVTERKQTEAKLAHQAMHDPLTGLPNRTLLTDRMLLAKARLQRGGSLALLFCDLDHFKAVNDSFGHDAGDRLLVEAADRLRSILRPSDTVSRFGGDEFALLCEGVEAEAAEQIACRIAEAFLPPFTIDGNEVSLSASIGIVLSADPDVDPDHLMSDADLAMYAAKQGGGARYALFGHEMGAHPPVFASPRRGARGGASARAGRT
jgi:diguanylate cyclase (GGDEF)-like protein/PAS domain S-box-containing protein